MPVESNDAPGLLVPPSLLRIRQYLTECGLKVRPWASPEETLDALRDVLQQNGHCPGFWHGLRELLGALTEDMQRRREAQGAVVDNEIFSVDQRIALMDELRDALAQHDDEKTFRQLTARLSSPAVAALCLVAGVALVGCGGQTDSPEGSGGSGVDVGSGGSGVDVGSGGSGFTVSSGGSGGTHNLGTGGTGEPPLCTEELYGQGGAGPGSSLRTIEEILTECEVNEVQAEQALDSIETMNACWQNGIREVLGGESCDDVEWQIRNMLDCAGRHGEGEFSLNAFLDSCAVTVYRGVPFE